MKIKFALLVTLGLIVSCSAGGDGFITVSADKKHFQHSDGIGFLPIGHNGWYEPEIFADRGRLDRYFSHMKEHGENLHCILLDGYPAPDVEVETRVGEFNPVVVNAMDNVIEAAEKHGVYLIVAFWAGFYDVLGAGNWSEHSYNRNHDPQNGLVEQFEELFTNEAAIEAEKARVRFFAERWGSSPSIFAWQIWNEVNIAGVSVEDQNRWIDEMGAFLRAVETALYGAHHLRTVSTNNAGWGTSSSGVYSSPELDFTSFHTYDLQGRVDINPYEGIPGFSRINPVMYFLFLHRSSELAIEKSVPRPVLGTEDRGIVRDTSQVPWPFNLAFENYTLEQLDDFFIGSEWASLMGGGGGPNLRWPCTPSYEEDSPDGYLALSTGMYGAQKAMRDILSTIDGTKLVPVSTEDAITTPGREDIIPMALAGAGEMLAWFLHDDLEFSGSEVRPSVTFRNLQQESYRITWYDLRTGDVLQEDTENGPEFTVLAPGFRRFVASVLTMP